MTSRERLFALGCWLVLGSVVGVVCGASASLFLWLLDLATAHRLAHPAIVFALPVAGLVIGAIYARVGASIAGGNTLVIDTIHDDGPEIPLRMAPLVLIGTVLTHLFGGSAGREGTAVQMGASLGDWLAHRLRLARPLRQQLVVAGVAAGFGAVFGTPIAGAVFALEFVVIGRFKHDALIIAVVAAIVGDRTSHALGTAHTAYTQPTSLAMTPLLLVHWLVFAAAVAVVAIVFIELTHFIKQRGARHLPRLPLRMFVGGVVVVALWQLVGTDEYLGLGIAMIERAFIDPALPPTAFALKLAFTAMTLGAGFLGGEVTPLFFIGACLGNALAQLLGLPIAMGAGVGMAAMFAAASNTPLALSIMAVELLGVAVLPHVVIVCGVAWWLTGNRSIYAAQRAAHDA